MNAANDEAYERGRVAGEVSARLANHDQHFAAINGSIDKLTVTVEQVNQGIRRLSDEAIARDRRWTPVQKVAASVGAVLTTVASSVGALYVVFARH